MTDIISNKESSSNIVLEMRDSTDAIRQKFDVNIAKQTTVLGNIRIHEITSELQSIIATFESSFQRDLDNIISITDEFEAMDNQFGQGIYHLNKY